MVRLLVVVVVGRWERGERGGRRSWVNGWRGERGRGERGERGSVPCRFRGEQMVTVISSGTVLFPSGSS